MFKRLFGRKKKSIRITPALRYSLIAWMDADRQAKILRQSVWNDSIEMKRAAKEAVEPVTEERE